MATLQTTTFNDSGNITLPAGPTANRPASPAAGMIRYNSTINLVEFYDGSGWRPVTGFSQGIIGSGGNTIYYKDNSIIHMFTSTGAATFTPAFTGNIQVLVVAGGASAGGSHGGGGGAGGVRFSRAFPVTAGTPYGINVGAGAPNNGGGYGNPGGPSTFSSITSTGGGGGGNWDNSTQAFSGGSGGGGGTSSAAGSRYRVPAGNGTQGQGFPGGSGIRFNRQGDNAHNGGGGGGAGGPGIEGSDNNNYGDVARGGPGLATSILGEVLYFGGGGGGSSHINPGGGGDGGVGGGGGGSVHHGQPQKPPSIPQGVGGGQALNSGTTASIPFGGAGGANTGGGGGSSNGTGGPGGSGIVIIRY